MENNLILPPYELLRGRIEGSFANLSYKVRIPSIFIQAIDTFNEVINKLDPTTESEKIKEGKEIIEKLTKLINDMKDDNKFIELIEDDIDNVNQWNEYIKYWKEKNEDTYNKSSWLFSECYLYRLMSNYYSLSKYWNEYDPFEKKKINSLIGDTWDSVIAFANYMNPIINDNSISLKKSFNELLRYSLWGNQADLSLHVNTKSKDVLKLYNTSPEQIRKNNENLISDDSIKVWEYISTLKEKRFDFILDNSGFETYNDLVFADWLVTKGFASEIVWHCKKIPWYVSDTEKKDFLWIVNTCSNPPDCKQGMDNENIIKLAKRWKEYINNGTWKLDDNAFWTSPFPYWLIQSQAPELYEDLSNSSLLIFKGDLNYRKLLYDCDWPHTTSFIEACGPLGNPTASGKKFPPFVALRTCKADLIAGLKEGYSEMLSKKSTDWLVNGKYGIIQFNDKNLQN